MQLFEQTINLPLTYPIDCICSLEELLFFDIETTGFQADVSSLYLIGCAFYKEGQFHLIQLFANDYRSEKEMLDAFTQIVRTHRTLLHFNGDGFDLPYLKKKYELHHLAHPFQDCQSIDLYKRIKPYKKFLNLTNYKQKTVEQFLNINRQDPYTGGQLIQVYVEYMKARFSYRETQPFLEPLLLHNKEDIIGMLELLHVLHYIDAFECNLPLLQTKVCNNYVEFQLQSKAQFPTPVIFQENYLYFELTQQQMVIRIAYYYGELKFFYPDYKNYYYLLKEDAAVHKSLAAYVDKEYRKKATASTCYQRKTAVFLPTSEQPGVPTYQADYHDKQRFLEVTRDWLNNHDLVLLYLKSLLASIAKH